MRLAINKDLSQIKENSQGGQYQSSASVNHGQRPMVEAKRAVDYFDNSEIDIGDDDDSDQDSLNEENPHKTPIASPKVIVKQGSGQALSESLLRRVPEPGQF